MGSYENGVVAGDRSATNNGGAPAVDKEVDFAQYFCTYAFLYHQKEMLSDRVRMDAYYNSIFQNKHHFKGKVLFFNLCLFFYCYFGLFGCWESFVWDPEKKIEAFLLIEELSLVGTSIGVMGFRFFYLGKQIGRRKLLFFLFLLFSVLWRMRV